MFGWVDFSDEERKRTATVLQLARQPGAIDELGLGVLRDGFADRLFPGTSTLHTHARYFFLISYLMKDLEKKYAGKPIEEVRQAHREGEKATARKLLAWCNSNGREPVGITGSNYAYTDKWVKQTPSMMDWAAIQSYGLLTDPNLKLSGFLNLVSKSKRRTIEADAEGDEHGIAMTTGLCRVPHETYADWNTGDEISLDLFPQEAQQLGQSICSKWPDSLYAAMILNPKQVKDLLPACELPGTGLSFILLADALDNSDELFPELGSRELCSKAADFSALAALLHIRFNCVLAQAAGYTEDDVAFTAWRDAIGTDKPYLERAIRCNAEESFSLAHASIGQANSRNGRTLSFLKCSQRAMTRGNTAELDELIKKREKSLKGSRSKIENAAVHATDSNGKRLWYGGRELTYRLYYGMRFASEIASPLRGDSHV